MAVPAVTVGRGAWTATGKRNGQRYYRWLQRWDNLKDGDSPTLDVNHQAVNLGTLAIQNRIKAVGYTGPLTPNGRFGSQTRNAVMWFQAENGLVADGIFGPASSRKAWLPLVEEFSGGGWAPAPHLWGMMTLESVFDPGAVSVLFRPEIGPDWGLCQISHQHLTGPARFTMEQVFDPRFAINYSAGRLAEARAEFDGKGPDLQRDCSIAAHNNPAAARRWYKDGTPPPPLPGRVPIAAYVAAVLRYADTYG